MYDIKHKINENVTKHVPLQELLTAMKCDKITARPKTASFDNSIVAESSLF